jgi:nitrate reductase NapE component
MKSLINCFKLYVSLVGNRCGKDKEIKCFMFIVWGEGPLIACAMTGFFESFRINTWHMSLLE